MKNIYPGFKSALLHRLKEESSKNILDKTLKFINAFLDKMYPWNKFMTNQRKTCILETFLG